MFIVIALILWFIVGLALGLSGLLENSWFERKADQVRRKHPIMAGALEYLEILVFCGPIAVVIAGLVDLYTAWWRFR